MAYIEKRGELQWRVQVRRQGFPVYSRTFELHKDAAGWGRDVEAAIGRRDLVELRRLTGDGQTMGGTVADLVDRYLEEVLPKRRNPGNEAPRLARIRGALGRLALPMLTPQDVAKWRDKRLAEGAAPGTVRHDLNTLSKLLGHAVSEWGTEGVRNIVRDVKKPALAKGRDRRVSQAEFDFLIKAAREGRPGAPKPSRGLAPLITLAVETSMRQGELVALRWVDVDLKHGVVTVRQSKNGDARSVALSSRAKRAFLDLKSVERIDSRVFDWADPHSVSRPFERCVRRAKELYADECRDGTIVPDPTFLSDVRFHDLRHEATSRLFEQGLNLMEVASMTGHKSMQMLKRYTHVDARRVAAKLG